MKIAILGAGNIGSAIYEQLYYHNLCTKHSQHEINLFDKNFSEKETSGCLNPKKKLDITKDLNKLKDYNIIISALPFFLNKNIIAFCASNSINYFDLTEDTETTEFAKQMPSKAVIIPQCGLAPGMINILANNLAKKFKQINYIKLKVGALPQYPNNSMKYNATWSPEGIINEYCNPCNIVSFGKQLIVPALSDLENFIIDGVEYESFNTSGGIGTLNETYSNINHLSYQTIRYKGHRDYIKFLFNDFCLNNKKGKDLLVKLFKRIPIIKEDFVLMTIFITGKKENDSFEKETFVKKIYSDENETAIQKTTAAGLCYVVDLFINDKIKKKGFVKQEEIPFEPDNYFLRIFK